MYDYNIAIHTCTCYTHRSGLDACTYAYIYIYIYIYIAYIHAYVHTYVHTHVQRGRAGDEQHCEFISQAAPQAQVPHVESGLQFLKVQLRVRGPRFESFGLGLTGFRSQRLGVSQVYVCIGRVVGPRNWCRQ